MSVTITQIMNQIPCPHTRRALKTLFDQQRADFTANKTAFDNHTHGCDGSEAGAYVCAKPGSDTSTAGTQTTASTFQVT